MKEMIAQKKYFFMAGLPRSGSALLSALLNQNPRFHFSPSSPVLDLMVSIENTLSQNESYNLYPKNQQAIEVIASVISHYYSDIEQPVIVDRNRNWLSHMHYIESYFGIEPKIICPVRNINEILASYISLHKKNPLEINGMINFIDRELIRNNIPLTDDNRCMFLSNPDGILGQSYNAIKQVLMDGKQDKLLFVEYEDIINNPQNVMRNIYAFLDEELFDHDFTKIENKYIEDTTSVYGYTEMHEVRSEISKKSTPPEEILSETIMMMCNDVEFWRNLDDFNNDTEDEDNLPVGVDESIDAYTEGSLDESHSLTSIIGA